MKKHVSVIGLSGDSIFLTVDHFHQDGETIIAKHKHQEPGGKGYNQALALSVLGVEVNFFSVVGDDLVSQSIINSLTNQNDLFNYSDSKNQCYLKDQKDHLDLLPIKPYFEIINNQSASIATILTDQTGANQVTVYPGASLAMSCAYLDQFAEIIKTSEYLLLQLELSETIIKHAIKIAKSAGVKIILNPAPYQSYLIDILPDIWLLTPNQNEYLLMANDLRDYHNLIVVTKGSKGATLIDCAQGLSYDFTCPKIDQVIDTTGAGDIFNAGVVAGLVEGKTLVEAIQQAVTIASHSTQTRYVIPSILGIEKN